MQFTDRRRCELLFFLLLWYLFFLSSSILLISLPSPYPHFIIIIALPQLLTFSIHLSPIYGYFFLQLVLLHRAFFSLSFFVGNITDYLVFQGRREPNIKKTWSRERTRIVDSISIIWRVAVRGLFWALLSDELLQSCGIYPSWTSDSGRSLGSGEKKCIKTIIK